MLDIFASEGIIFQQIRTDRSFAHENKPTRKPGIGLLGEYFSNEYDLANSYVIGDRLTDVELAKNLGAKGILIGELKIPAELQPYTALQCANWTEIHEFFLLPARRVLHERNTHETKISIDLNLDGKGVAKNETGLGLFDPM